MHIAKAFSVVFKTATDKFTAELTAALKKEPLVSCVNVENLSSARMTLKLWFIYAGAKVSAWCDSQYISSDHVWGTMDSVDIKFEGSHDSIASMIVAIRKKYPSFLQSYAVRIISEPLNEPTLNKKQIVLMKQSALIEAGFNVECEYMKNGDFKLIVTHDACKGIVLLNTKVA